MSGTVLLLDKSEHGQVVMCTANYCCCAHTNQIPAYPIPDPDPDTAQFTHTHPSPPSSARAALVNVRSSNNGFHVNVE